MNEQPTHPAGAVGPGAPGGGDPDGSKPPMKKGLVFGGLAVLAVVALGLLAVNFLLPDEEPLAVGDCIAEQPGALEGTRASDVLPEPLDCSDPEATYEVLAIRDAANPIRCLDVAGSTNAVTFDGVDIDALCLMEIGGDVERNINLIKAGECMTMEGDFGVRAECGSPGAMEVLAVIDGPGDSAPDAEGSFPVCRAAGVPEAEYVYTWGLDETYSFADDEVRAVCLAAPA